MEKSYNYAKDGFVYLLSYATLLISSLSANFLLKGLVNNYVPDVLDVSRSFPGSGDLIGFFAAIIVAFPVFWYLNWYANRLLKEGKMLHTSGVRRWLLYITLVVVILIIIWQFIQMFIAYLGGSLVIRLFLHILVTLLISFLVLGYQWWYLKLDDKQSDTYVTTSFKVFEYFVLLIVVLSIVGTLFVIDSPSIQRDKRLDRTRVNKLLSIHESVQIFYGYKDQGNQRLPESLVELVNDPLVYIEKDGLNDPFTGKLFDYRILSSSQYELCAVFATDNQGEEFGTSKMVKQPLEPLFEGDKGFAHPIGEHCFALSVRT